MEYMTIQELADYTGIKISTLRSYRLKKKIPFIKINGCLRFSRSEIDQWIEGFKVPVLSRTNQPSNKQEVTMG